MKKIQLTIFWIAFFFASFYFLGQVDRWYVSSRVPVSLPQTNYFLDMWDDGGITITGTIRGKDDDYYDDFNVINVNCDFVEKRCTHTIAGLFRLGQSDYEPLLNGKTHVYQVINWNKEFLIYRQVGGCYVSTFTLMRNTKTLTGVTKYSKNMGSCRRDDEVSFSIINGFDFVQSEKEKFKGTFANFFVWMALFCISAYGIFRVLRLRK